MAVIVETGGTEGNSTSFQPSLSGITPGDLLVVGYGKNGGGAVITPSGWTAIGSPGNVNGAFYKVAAPGDSIPSFNWGSGVARSVCSISFRIQDYDLADIIKDIVGMSTGSVDDTAYSATMETPGDLLITISGYPNDFSSFTASTPSPGCTADAFRAQSTTAGSDSCVGAAQLLWDGNGSPTVQLNTSWNFSGGNVSYTAFRVKGVSAVSPNKGVMMRHMQIAGGIM